MPKMISKRVLEVLEKRLNVKSKLPPVILYLKDSFGRCFIKNHGLELTRMSFKTEKTMKNYLETIYKRNDIHYIYWDEDFETED
jgi:hypothetical protein